MTLKNLFNKEQDPKELEQEIETAKSLIGKNVEFRTLNTFLRKGTVTGFDLYDNGTITVFIDGPEGEKAETNLGMILVRKIIKTFNLDHPEGILSPDSQSSEPGC
jgi:hypothetical protein